MMSSMSKLAVVTGAGSGVGRAVVVELAKRGWNVALVGRHERTLAETIFLAGQTTGKLAPFPCDVSDPALVQATTGAVREALGDARALVNCAGTNVANRSLEEVSVEDYQQVIAIN